MAKQSSAQHADRQREIPTATEKKLDELYELIDGIEIAMMTTRRPDGHLVSRPMATQGREAVADLWYVTDITTHKLDELERDPHVNLAFYNGRTREWVSVSGTATISQDRETIRRLYKPDWKAWFKEENQHNDGGGATRSDPRAGTPDDPRIALVLVEANSVTYLKVDKPRPVVLFEVLKAMVTHSKPNVGEVRELAL
jgi:general stress protein 26